MGTKDQLIEALSFTLEPGETIQTWRPVVTNGKVAESTYQTTLALLGPSAYCAATRGAVASVGEVPSRTNLVVVTDRRVLWCNKTRINGEIVVGGSDHLDALHSVDIVPARIALAKLRFVFHDGSVVQFDLPSDHRADDFALDTARLLLHQPTAA
ncbi:MAG: hypothetical protein P8I99_00335 [Acidimicrobiales bacterium]|nr:hypothetical protein [Acidimicrobiales bacterium]MDG1875843.1 hypothetical protein [Acidimicrobiales bacterium]